MVRVPKIIQYIFNKAVWRIPTDEKIVFLTFDDGPSEATNIILEILQKKDIPATFFQLGINAQKWKISYPKNIVLANHGFEHLNGLKTPNFAYWDNVYQNKNVQYSKIFRPPYGKLSWKQYKILQKTHKIVMWSILSYDYDLELKDEQIIKNIVSNLHKGAIIVLHDQDKLKDRLSNILPKIIEKIREKGYEFGDLAKHLKEVTLPGIEPGS